MRIGFVGLGRMGAPMACALLGAGHELTVHNRTRSRAEALGRAGSRVGRTPAEAARHAEVLVTMLADDVAVEAVMTDGPDAALPALPRGAVHVAVSTIGADPPAAHLVKLAVRAGGRGREAGVGTSWSWSG
jgi:3-hydroxyisobutyrate dehydrogenase-like beta-hydroxyacid dehydrogenase